MNANSYRIDIPRYTPLQDNAICIFYSLKHEFVVDHWVKTGKFVGFGQCVIENLDTEEKRQVVADCGWELVGFDDYQRKQATIGSTDERGLTAEPDWRYDRFLNGDDLWREVRRWSEFLKSKEEDE